MAVVPCSAAELLAASGELLLLLIGDILMRPPQFYWSPHYRYWTCQCSAESCATALLIYIYQYAQERTEYYTLHSRSPSLIKATNLFMARISLRKVCIAMYVEFNFLLDASGCARVLVPTSITTVCTVSTPNTGGCADW